MKKLRQAALFLLITTVTLQCEKEDALPATADLQLLLAYAVDAAGWYPDSFLYANADGNEYEINRLEYYISGITLHAADSSIYTSDAVYYVNARELPTNRIQLDDVPSGSYTYLEFYIGLDSAHNISYSLPNTPENINMAWPVMMGGGYHFLKLEGHYLQDSVETGFAVHLGRNAHLVRCRVDGPFFVGWPPYTLNLTMNVNEWFVHPHAYDLEVDGNYTMSDNAAMKKIAENGSDVFSLTQP